MCDGQRAESEGLVVHEVGRSRWCCVGATQLGLGDVVLVPSGLVIEVERYK